MKEISGGEGDLWCYFDAFKRAGINFSFDQRTCTGMHFLVVGWVVVGRKVEGMERQD